MATKSLPMGRINLKLEVFDLVSREGGGAKVVLSYVDFVYSAPAGVAGVAALLRLADSQEFSEHARVVQVPTPYQAAYQAIILALEMAREMAPSLLVIFCRSKRVVDEFSSKFPSEENEALYLKAQALMNQFRDVRIQHVRPETVERVRKVAQRLLAQQLGLPLSEAPREEEGELVLTP